MPKPKSIPVFIINKDSGKLGNGNYNCLALFIREEVQIPFSIYAHSENEYINSIGTPKPLKLEKQQSGILEDWSIPRSDSDYGVKDIINKVLEFKRITNKKFRTTK
jgi:hypothetical protein